MFITPSAVREQLGKQLAQSSPFSLVFLTLKMCPNKARFFVRIVSCGLRYKLGVSMDTPQVDLRIGEPISILSTDSP